MQGQQLQYFEALMLVCERLGCPEGAAQFAQAAVHQVDAAYSGEGADEAARQARESRLWTNLFVYYLEAGRMEVRCNFLPAWLNPCLLRMGPVSLLSSPP